MSPVPAVQWTGFYIGGHVGGAGGTFTNSFGTAIGPADSSGGYIAGGQLGFNWQTGSLVLGLEGDLSGINIRASTPAIGDFKEKSMETVRGRIGYAFDRWLPYLTAGVAFTQVSTSVTGGGSASGTATGFAGGGGIEYMLTPNWTVAGEALYVNVPKQTYTMTGGPVIGGSDNWVARVKINYLFH